METINNGLAGKLLDMAPCGRTYAELLRLVLTGQGGLTLWKSMTCPAKIMVGHQGAEVLLEEQMAEEFIRQAKEVIESPPQLLTMSQLNALSFASKGIGDTFWVFSAHALGMKHLQTVTAASHADALKVMQETAVFNALMRLKNSPTSVVKPTKTVLQEVLDMSPGWVAMLAPQIEEIMCSDECHLPWQMFGTGEAKLDTKSVKDAS